MTLAEQDGGFPALVALPDGGVLAAWEADLRWVSRVLSAFALVYARIMVDLARIGVALVYDHHVRMLTAKLTELQHKYHSSIISTLHVHLDHGNCLEVILVKGRASVVQKLADSLIATEGVKHARFTATTPHQ